MEDPEDFLRRVEEVERQIKGLKDGTINVDDVTLDGEKVLPAEEPAPAKQKKAQTLSAEETAEKEAKKKAEEHESWWSHARHAMGADVEETGSELATKPKRILDYSKWDKWVADPDDPVSKEEKARLEKEQQDKNDAEFEKLNPEFCGQFKKDLEVRQKAEQKRQADSKRLKDEGNAKVRAGQWDEAAKLYKKALKITPLEVPLLTNLAQVALKKEAYEDVVEWTTRALFIDPKCVKALFRRAMARKACHQYTDALADLQAGVAIEPDNVDLAKELRLCKVAAEAQDEETDLTKRLASLSSASSDDSTSAASSSARQLSVRSNLDPSLTPFANLSAIASRLNPALQTILDAVPAGAITVDALTSMSPLQADLRAVGACLNTDDCHVFLRTSGLLSRLCITFRLCATLLIDVCESAPSAVPTPSWFSALQAVSLTLAATSETPTNRAVIMSSGAAAALVRAVSVATVQSATVGTKTSPVEETSSALAGLELSYLPALLTLLEILLSSKDVDIIAEVGKTSRLLPNLLSCVERFITDPSTDPSIEECACHSASIIQMFASYSSHPNPEIVSMGLKLSKALLATKDVVSTFLRCVASLIGRAVISERYLTGQLMQHVVGGLANLAQTEELRGKFTEPFPDVKLGSVRGSLPVSASARGQPMLRALLDLCRLPVPACEEWTIVQGSSFAALCNAALGQVEVLVALREADADDALLDVLEGRIIKSGIKFANPTRGVKSATTLPPEVSSRVAALLARLTQDADMCSKLRTPAKFDRLLKLTLLVMNSCSGNPLYVDSMIRILAGVLTTADHATQFCDSNGFETSVAHCRAVLANGPGSNLEARWPGIGNLLKTIITVLGAGTNLPCQAAAFRSALPDCVVEVLRQAPDESVVRKNAAVVIAKLAKYPESQAKLRENGGIQALLRLKDTLL